MAKKRFTKPAFTLLEILVTLSILALILGSVYGTYVATTSSLTHCKAKNALQQQARVFLQRITSEIRCCYAGYQYKPSQGSLNLQTNIQKVLKNENPSFFAGRQPSSGQTFLRFVTSALTAGRDRDIRGLALVEYRLDESSRTLLRSKRRHTDGFENDDTNHDWLVVLEKIQAITVEYFDGKRWLKKWESSDIKGLLPRAVRISVSLQDDDVRTTSFASTANIACRGNRSGQAMTQKAIADGGLLSSENSGIR